MCLKYLCKVELKPLSTGDWSKKGREAPGIKHYIDRFNGLSDFVIWSILNSKGRENRSNKLRMWIDVQKQCFNLNNMSTCVALVSAIQSVPIGRLIDRDLVDVKSSHKKWLEFFRNKILGHNKKGYRRILRRVLNEGESCIPFLACHLGDLTFIIDGNPDSLEGC